MGARLAVSTLSAHPARPSIGLALPIDAALAVACYVLAYRLRFSGDMFQVFWLGMSRSLPLVVACQMALLMAAGVYSSIGLYKVVPRLLVGAAAGSLAAAGLTRLVFGYDGLSRVAFVVDALLFVMTTIAWRAGRALWLRSQAEATRSDADDDLIDPAVGGPSFATTILSVVRYRELLRSLVLKDLKLKYRGSVLGFVWSLMNPLMLIVVYTLAFSYIMRVGGQGFVFFLLIGILAWTFFASTVTMAAGAIVDNGGLVKSVQFPRAILPISAVLFNLAQYLLTAIVFLPAMLFLFRVAPAAPMLLFPVFLALQVIFTLGLALMLSTGAAFFRDIRHLVEIGLMLLFWLTPIVYDLSQVPERIRLPILLSPMSAFVVAYQQIFYYQQWPALSVWLVALTYAGVMFLVGVWLFIGFEDRLPEQV